MSDPTDKAAQRLVSFPPRDSWSNSFKKWLLGSDIYNCRHSESKIIATLKNPRILAFAAIFLPLQGLAFMAGCTSEKEETSIANARTGNGTEQLELRGGAASTDTRVGALLIDGTVRCTAFVYQCLAITAAHCNGVATDYLFSTDQSIKSSDLDDKMKGLTDKNFVLEERKIKNTGTGKGLNRHDQTGFLVLRLERSYPGQEAAIEADPKSCHRGWAVGYGATGFADGTFSGEGSRKEGRGDIFDVDLSIPSVSVATPAGAPHTCNGDSGGPLLTEDRKAYIGILSTGSDEACSDKADTARYLALAPFKAEIEQLANTWCASEPATKVFIEFRRDASNISINYIRPDGTSAETTCGGKLRTVCKPLAVKNRSKIELKSAPDSKSKIIQFLVRDGEESSAFVKTPVLVHEVKGTTRLRVDQSPVAPPK